MAVSFFMPFKSTDGRAEPIFPRGAGRIYDTLLSAAFGVGPHTALYCVPARCGLMRFAAAGALFFLFSGEAPATCLFGM